MNKNETIKQAYSDYLESEMNDNTYKNIVNRYIAILDEIETLLPEDKKNLTRDLDDVEGELVACESEKAFEAGFNSGLTNTERRLFS